MALRVKEKDVSNNPRLSNNNYLILLVSIGYFQGRNMALGVFMEIGQVKTYGV